MERSRSVKLRKDRQIRASGAAAAARRAREAAGGSVITRADETEELFGVEM